MSQYNGNERRKTEAECVLRPSGGYQGLKVYKVATLIYDVTVRFVELYIPDSSRTCDQRIQAARSGKQNIAEGSVDAATSAKLEINLYNVARGSLEELKVDYVDYLRQHGENVWANDHLLAKKFIAMQTLSNAQFREFVQWAEENSPTVPFRSIPLKSVIVANAAILLINVASYWLKKLIVNKLNKFLKSGGFSERLAHCRNQQKRNGK